MENGLYTTVEFDDNDKWFVIAEKVIDGSKYSYMIRLNQSEDDFIDEYQVVKSYFDGNEEYMDLVNGDELRKVVPILVDDAKELIKNPERIKELLNN